ncbi:unknown [Acidaminococcus intestini CAG:325]|nr:unknown [Acidaminococcus intestini CAG:325]
MLRVLGLGLLIYLCFFLPLLIINFPFPLSASILVIIPFLSGCHGSVLHLFPSCLQGFAEGEAICQDQGNQGQGNEQNKGPNTACNLCENKHDGASKEAATDR